MNKLVFPKLVNDLVCQMDKYSFYSMVNHVVRQDGEHSIGYVSNQLVMAHQVTDRLYSHPFFSSVVNSRSVHL